MFQREISQKGVYTRVYNIRKIHFLFAALLDLWCKQEVKLKAIFIIIIPLFHSIVGGGPTSSLTFIPPQLGLPVRISRLSCQRFRAWGRQRRRKWHHQPKNALCTMRRWEEPSRTTSGAPKSIAEQQQGSDQLMHKKKNEEKGTWILDRQPLHQKSARTIRLPHLFLTPSSLGNSNVSEFLFQPCCSNILLCSF